MFIDYMSNFRAHSAAHKENQLVGKFKFYAYLVGLVSIFFNISLYVKHIVVYSILVSLIFL